MLMSSPQDARKNRMRLGSRLGLVAAIGFSDDPGRAQGVDGGTNHALGLVVRSVQCLDIKKPQEMRLVFAKPFGKASVVGIGEAPLMSNQTLVRSLQR